MTKQQNDRTKFTRMCIAEAIIDLMQDHSMEEIRISAVANRAGVSRMTFYHYYDSIQATLIDYLQEIIAEYLEECKNNPNTGTFLELPHILFALNFFDKYSFFFLTLVKQGLHCILLDGINQFMLQHFSTSRRHSVNEMYCYSGGLLNIFLKWEEGQKQESPEEIASVVYHLYNKC